MSASMLMLRPALRRGLLPLGIGLSTGVLMAARQRPARLDAHSYSPPPPSSPRRTGGEENKEFLSPEIIKQMSGGSLTGFLAGVLVSVFSRTLVLLVGLGIVAVQIAARYGVDLVAQSGLRKRVEGSRVLAALRRNPTFKLSFGVTFALAAFMQF